MIAIYYIYIYQEWLMKTDDFGIKNDKDRFRGYNQMYIYLVDTMLMHMSRSKIRNISLAAVGIFFTSLAFLYSDNVMVGYSEFAFLSGATEMKTLQLEVT